MSKLPVLILQMQRMGDLVLSFPLLSRLREALPGTPLWVVGEPQFFKPLLPLSPQATYFSYDSAPDLKGNVFHMVINLSFRPEAAAMARRARTDRLIGPWADDNGRLFIAGDWQLYRASLTHNNRYNRYHWADLNVLDALAPDRALVDDWLKPRPILPSLVTPGGAGLRLGLFLGASEAEKRPNASFWAGLAKILMNAGHKPVLLGGRAETDLGREVAHLLGAGAPNMTGRFSVAALAQFIGELDLLVTPDTGPMHIASGLGTPVLNLSMGPVNPWETGPSAPGHHVLRPALDCTGCWRCTQESVRCREEFTHSKVAAVIERLLTGEAFPQTPPMRRRMRGLEILRTARDENGLYRLDSLLSGGYGSTTEFEARPALARFWQSWFGELFGFLPQGDAGKAWAHVRERHPLLAGELAEAAAAFALELARTFRTSPGDILASPRFWQQGAPIVQPLSGYIQMYAQNALGSREAFLHVLSLAESVAELSV